MKILRIIGIVIILTSTCTYSWSQSNDYLAGLEHIFDKKKHSHHYGQQILKADNPIDFLFSTMYVSYKVLLSSQDMDSCVFTPSCSTYSIRSIKKYGLFLGLAATFDRLSRCHPFGGKHYPQDLKNNRLYDPVE